MKLTVRTLNGSGFEIRVQPSDTIMEVKKNIENARGKGNYPCGRQLLIHNGKILKDESTLAENQVSEVGFIVLMLNKNKELGSGGTSSIQPAPASIDAPIADTIPMEHTGTHSVTGTGLGSASASASASAPVVTASEAPNSSPLNLFPQENLYPAAGAGAGALDFLRDNQQFQALRSMVQADPQNFQLVLQELGEQNPQLLHLIVQHHQEFLQLITEPLDCSEGGLFDQDEQDMAHVISFTPAEREIIDRLEAMGFDRDLVIEAFLAGDRNEALAIDYLLEYIEDYEHRSNVEDSEDGRSKFK